MADNDVLPLSGPGGGVTATVRTIEKGAAKHQVVVLDIGGAGAESLLTTANPMPVSDNGGSLTVDGSVSLSAVVPGTGATNLGKAEDAAHTTGDVGVMALAVQQSADSAFGADGDYGPLQLDANGFLKVNIKAGAGSGGTASTDDGAFTAGSGSGTPMMGFATSDVVDSGDVGVLRMTTTRDLMVTMRDSAGDSAMDDANNALRVNVVAGSSGGPSKADDAAFTIATDTVAPMGALADETAPDSVDEGDVGIPRMTLDRKLLTRIVGATDANRLDVDGSGHAQTDIAAFSVALPAGTNNIGDVDVLTVPAPLSTTGGGTEGTALRVTIASDSTGVLSIDDNGGSLTVDGTVTANAGTGTFTVGGVAAADAAVSGNPVLVAGRASAAAPADMSADGDVVTAWRLRNGAAATVLTAAGALIGGDAANGLDVDVTRVPAPLSTTGGGTEATALRVTVASDSTGVLSVDDNGASLTVDGTITANAGTGTFTVGGAAAHDAAISGNPVRSAGRARTADVTAVAQDDTVDLIADTLGKQIVLIGAVPDQQVNGKVTLSNTTASDVIAAAGAGVKIAVMGVLVTNASASVATKVEIRDGTTVKIQALAGIGGGFTLNGSEPLFYSTANTAITARCVTTSADVDIFIWGHKCV